MTAALLEQFDTALMRTLRSVINAAPSTSLDTDGLNAVINDLRYAFGNAITSLRRSYNGQYSRQHRLPDELWCLVWGFLPIHSLLSVSHVCHHWRQLAISCPSLWCALEFSTSVHSHHCRCRQCGDEDEDFAVAHQAGSCNIDYISSVLPRSGALYLSLHISVSAKRAKTSIIDQLVHSLQPHAERISALHFTALTSIIAHAFFPQFQTLPRLRYLVVNCASDDQWGGVGLDYLAPNVVTELSLPSLVHLTVTGGLGIQLRLPASLAVLRCPFQAPEEVLAYVRQTPNLQELHLRVPRQDPKRNPNNPQDFDTLRNACARILRIEVSNISEWLMDRAVHLAGPEYRDLTFRYTETSTYDRLSPLSTIAHPTWLSLLRNQDGGCGEQIVMAIGDGHRKRTIYFPLKPYTFDGYFTSEWNNYTVPLGASCATVDLALLPLIPQRVADIITTLVIEMPSCAHHLPASRPCFSTLETVEFRIDALDQPEDVIFDLVQSLRPPARRKLKRIVFRGEAVSGDGTLLSQLAEEVALGPVPVA